MYKLYLDDIRFPHNTYPTTHDSEWVIARSYDEFVAIITERGMPFIISFDHDLSFEHYPFNEKDGGIHSPRTIPYDQYKEKTGFHCAKWLVEKCMDDNVDLPKWYVQSANTVGAENIRSYLTSYERSRT